MAHHVTILEDPYGKRYAASRHNDTYESVVIVETRKVLSSLWETAARVHRKNKIGGQVFVSYTFGNGSASKVHGKVARCTARKLAELHLSCVDELLSKLGVPS